LKSAPNNVSAFWKPVPRSRLGDARELHVIESARPRASRETLALLPDDLAREVYCVLGAPIDAAGMATALGRIESAAAGGRPFLLSTANLNFLVTSLVDPAFAKSLRLSDLCTADGVPVVWICRALGIPIRERVAGSDIIERLKQRRAADRPMRVFFFGGAEGVADAACRSLNAQPSGLAGAGSMYPGYGSLEELGSAEKIDAINASAADLLVVALGASKGQAWLLRNHHRIKVPVRAHLGAVVNFQAGTLGRAPERMQKLGLEWLWRIKEEPLLWRRYWHDGCTLLRLAVTRILPLAVRLRRQARDRGRRRQTLDISATVKQHGVYVRLSGAAVEGNIETAITHLRAALAANKPLVTLDLSRVDAIDPRFLGLLLMLRKRLAGQGGRLEVAGVTPATAKLFRLNEAGFLLDGQEAERC
jgi:N-acetylglucosaminyldiphosphoundecaprenol N-acetyl-beta-D-mannosaminyltransferase